MQLRFKAELTATEYVRRHAWEEATLSCCPLHPNGGCAFARHGTYGRVHPPGARIARWYCPQGHCTFSLLPNCFSARLPGSLTELQEVVLTAEQSTSLEAAANRVRGDDIALQGALRWTRRRVQQVHRILRLLVCLIPALRGCQPTLGAVRQWLQIDAVLPALRDIADCYLPRLPAPLGFATGSAHALACSLVPEHDKGPDPPAARA